jgi:5-methylcytosine-specific restriction endonuclease McrA
VNARTKRWQEANPKAFTDYYQQHRDSLLKRSAEWRKENQDSRKEGYKRWASQNKGAVNALVAKRIAAKKRALPAWADVSAIKAVYREAAQRTRDTGERWEVDHIVPLQSPIVCGLHVHWNLQLLPKLENVRKGNRLLTPHIAAPHQPQAPSAESPS